MTPAFLIMLIVAVPCAFIAGVVYGWQRGSAHTEQSIATTIGCIRAAELLERSTP